MPRKYEPMTPEVIETLVRAFLFGNAVLRDLLAGVGQPRQYTTILKKHAYATGRADAWDAAARRRMNLGTAALNRNKRPKVVKTPKPETILDGKVVRRCMFCRAEKLMPILEERDFKAPNYIGRFRRAICPTCNVKSVRIIRREPG